MSVSSTMSSVSVSFRESEVGVEQALDVVFKELQTHLNSAHCNTRQLACLSEQDGDWNTSVDLSLDIIDGCSAMGDLFKELKSVVQQVRGRASNDAERKYLKVEVDRRKTEKMSRMMASTSLGVAPE